MVYKTEYTMGTDNFWKFATEVFWSFFAIIMLAAFVSIGVACNAERLDTGSFQQNTSADTTLIIVKVFTITIDMISNFLFWFLVAMSGGWFILFKF